MRSLESLAPLSFSTREYPDSANARVLIVEDDFTLRRLLESGLETTFGGIVGCQNAEQALELLRQSHYDVVVTDLELPGMSGLELASRVAQDFPGTRSVLISGRATGEECERARSLGVVRILLKPLVVDELKLAVANAVEARQGFQSELHGISLIDVLQLYHQAKRSVMLRTGYGTIAIRGGEIVHAQAGDLSGEAALRMVLAHRAGVIHSDALGLGPVTIHAPFQMLLLDALRLMDEQRGEGEGNPDSVGMSLVRERNHRSFRIALQGNVAALCTELLAGLEGAQNCAVVDVFAGTVVGEASDDAARGILSDPVAKSLLATFCEQAARNLDASKSQRSQVEEVCVASSTHHYVARSIIGGRAAVVLIVERNTLIGAARAQILAHLPRIEQGFQSA